MKVRFLADENFNNNILRGLLRRNPDCDVVRVQDVGLYGAPDPEILDWAAQEERILLTHDVATMTAHAAVRLRAGKPVAGVLEVRRSVPMKQVIEELLLIFECSAMSEWCAQIRYIPL